MHDILADTRGGLKAGGADPRPKVLVLFGTRPEVIKLAPVIHELKNKEIRTVVVSSSQHKELLDPFLAELRVDVDHDLAVMRHGQSPNDVASRVIAKLDKVLAREQPHIVIVQGDTTTTFAGALAAFNRQIPVGHVEAGLRSGNLMSPFPEELNRRLVSQMASLHFAATEKNRSNLVSEGVASEKIFITGNPIVDSLRSMLTDLRASEKLEGLISATHGTKRLVLTTHRRENFGSIMTENLKVIRDFVTSRRDVHLMFPVHPNPRVRSAAKEIMGECERIHLLEPLDYSDFLALMRAAWLIISDSGGVQEEAPTLGKPLLIIRENTERPEALRSGVSKLIGNDPRMLRRVLEENHSIDTWIKSVRETANPFGDGHAAARIVRLVEEQLSVMVSRAAQARVRV